MKNIFGFILCGLFCFSLSSCESKFEKSDISKPNTYDSSFNVLYKDSALSWRQSALTVVHESKRETQIVLLKNTLHKRAEAIFFESGGLLILVLVVTVQRNKINSLNKKMR